MTAHKKYGQNQISDSVWWFHFYSIEMQSNTCLAVKAPKSNRGLFAYLWMVFLAKVFFYS